MLIHTLQDRTEVEFKEVCLHVSDPQKGSDDWSCAVLLTPFDLKIKRIYGVDAGNAYENAVSFAKKMMQGRTLTFCDGSPFTLFLQE